MSVAGGVFRADGPVPGWDTAAVGDGGAAIVDQRRDPVAAHRRSEGGPIVFG
jgi:hypothetical protein